MSHIRRETAKSQRMADIQQWCRRTVLLPALAIVFVANTSDAAQGDEPLIASPVSAMPTDEVHDGKLVWVDLVTTDPQKAVDFYVAVFDWQPRFFADQNYIELSHNGNVISSVVRYEDDEAVAGDARWLVSISVDDVDAATQLAVGKGGEILEPATDLPSRGRYSVISDPQGAVLMLLRATGGDPADTDDAFALNEWAWAELWTDDPDASLSFYKAIAGYGSLRVPEADGGEHIVLGTGGKARATVVQLPWDDVEPNWIPYVPVASVSKTLQRIADAGGALLLQSDGSQTSGAVAIVMDPTGGVFAVQQMRVE